MKSFLKYSGLIAFVVALVGFILLMATPSMNFQNAVEASGIDGIFGKGAPWPGIVAWILTLIAIIALIIGLLPLFNVTALEKFSSIINIIAAIALILAGIIVFFEASAFNAANKIMGQSPEVKLCAGWIISGILLIVSGVCAALPKLFSLGKN